MIRLFQIMTGKKLNTNQKNVYNDIANNIEDLIEDAISKAGTY